MAKNIYLQFLTAFMLFGINVMNGQTKSQAAQEQEAYMYLNSQDYVNAYTMFDKLHAKYPNELDYEEKLGVCCLYYPEKKARAIEIFEQMSTKYKRPIYDYYLGKAYHVNYKFDEAIAVLEPLIEKLSSSKKKEDKALVEDATLGVTNCKNGKYLVANKIFADIKNVGAPINSKDNEYVPIITADESIMYFTYRGEKSVGGKQPYFLKPEEGGADGYYYSEDIYYSTRKTDLTYSEPKAIESLNTKGFEAAIGISPDGSMLFTFNSSGSDSGDIFVSKLNGENWETPVRLNSNINTDGFWEGSCSISADGKHLYFASERPGGLGGRDLYVSELINGEWGPATNLGPKINTKYDDDAPFIHPDGITLFFSSKGHLSIGGYDIMFSIKKDNDWADPKSMGIPLNTTEDDTYYTINSKGDKGYFSSNRAGSGGLGNLDIYEVTPGILGDKPVVALLKGIVYGNDKPVEAKIEILKAQKENVGPFASNKATGKYLMALSPGSVYNIKVSSPGFETVEENLDIENLNIYMEKNKDFFLFSADILAARKAAREDSIQQANAKNTANQPKVTDEKTTSGTTEPTKTTEPKDEKHVAIVEPVKPKKGKDKKPKDETAANTGEENNKTTDNSNFSDQLPDLSPVKGKSLNDAVTYSQLLDLAGNYGAAGVVFKVQIGAYRMPANYKAANLKSLGKIESEIYPDGITRFTQNEFKTLKAAEKHRKKAIAKGQTDAWIVVFKDGKRFTLEDFIMVDFQSKTVN